MRAFYMIPVVVLLLAVGWLFAFDRSSTLPVPPAANKRPASTREVPPPPPPLRSAMDRPSTVLPPPGLTCLQNALGGAKAFAGVSSLYIVGRTKPIQTTGMRPVSNNRELSVVLPHRYRRADLQTDIPSGWVPLQSVVGFNGPLILSEPRGPEDAAVMRSARKEFVREMLMRLPGELADVLLSQRPTHDAGRERFAIDAYLSDELVATLTADAQSCMPVELQYKNTSDALPYTVELSEYRRFGGIQFPTVLRTMRNGQPWAEEQDSDVRLNSPEAAKPFAQRR